MHIESSDIMTNKLLEVSNLVTQFSSPNGNLKAIKNISFSINQGETVCVVGESGCGKSITALSIMGLLPNNGKIVDGSINFKEHDISKLTNNEMQKIRGNKIAMIFQEPMTSLNPVFTIGFQIRESLMNHLNITKKEAHQRGIELLKKVNIPSPEVRMKQYPHELSGGMRQRVMIAMALSCNPSLLIADEPTTALDVTIQAEILELIIEIKQQFGMGILMITHDMGVVGRIADRVIVMYAGEIIEEGDVYSIFSNPQHPYTKGLLASVPDVDKPHFDPEPIPGSLPSLDENVSGCLFHPRCKYVTEKCRKDRPKTFYIHENHKTNCWLLEVNDH
jgi:oligopeptide/dipeptide ABC transporter ATP-binding protein